jgi:hypothetical protein
MARIGISDREVDRNAGFWIEEVGTLDRVYHCSAGPLKVPTLSRSYIG